MEAHEIHHGRTDVDLSWITEWLWACIMVWEVFCCGIDWCLGLHCFHCTSIDPLPSSLFLVSAYSVIYLFNLYLYIQAVLKCAFKIGNDFTCSFLQIFECTVTVLITFKYLYMHTFLQFKNGLCSHIHINVSKCRKYIMVIRRVSNLIGSLCLYHVFEHHVATSK